jgi:hypothetical protein
MKVEIKDWNFSVGKMERNTRLTQNSLISKWTKKDKNLARYPSQRINWGS